MNQIAQTIGRPAPQYPDRRFSTKLILFSGGVILSLLICCSAMAMGTFGGILLFLGNFVHFNMDTSQNWSGYTFPQGSVTGVRAAWVEPSLSDRPANADVSIWVGIGGMDESYDNLIQIGTSAYVSDGHALDAVWYETLPANHLVTIGTLSPNDHVFASIELKRGSNQMWDLLLVNLTRKQRFSAEISFSSMRVYADFIVEDPTTTSNSGPPYAPFPHFASVEFSKVNVCYKGDWTSVGAIQAIQITLVQSGVAMARPSPLRNDAFIVQRS